MSYVNILECVHRSVSENKQVRLRILQNIDGGGTSGLYSCSCGFS